MEKVQLYETSAISKSVAEEVGGTVNMKRGIIDGTSVQKMIDNSPRQAAQGEFIAQLQAAGNSAGNLIPVQRQGEEDETQQRKVETMQRANEDEQALQGKFTADYACPVLQAKTKVITNLGDGEDGKTSNKLIETPTQGQKWFRFAKDDKVINSFANNITTKTPAGASPVNRTIDLANTPDVTPSDIPSMTRPQHFRMGDSLAGISDSDRTDTWTWHHKVDKYKMELVDMYAHGGFYHYGGFSQWDMDEDDAKD